MISGLSHITFIVRDLDRMETVLTQILRAKKVYDSGRKTFSLSRKRFFLVGTGSADTSAPVWIAIMEGKPLEERTYNHVAFKIDEADYEDCLERVPLARSRYERRSITGRGRRPLDLLPRRRQSPFRTAHRNPARTACALCSRRSRGLEAPGELVRLSDQAQARRSGSPTVGISGASQKKTVIPAKAG